LFLDLFDIGSVIISWEIWEIKLEKKPYHAGINISSKKIFFIQLNIHKFTACNFPRYGYGAFPGFKTYPL
jgi:hypothetical protein